MKQKGLLNKITENFHYLVACQDFLCPFNSHGCETVRRKFHLNNLSTLSLLSFPIAQHKLFSLFMSVCIVSIGELMNYVMIKWGHLQIMSIVQFDFQTRGLHLSDRTNRHL